MERAVTKKCSHFTSWLPIAGTQHMHVAAEGRHRHPQSPSLSSPQRPRGDHLRAPWVPFQLPAVGLERPAEGACHGWPVVGCEAGRQTAAKRRQKRRRRGGSFGRLGPAANGSELDAVTATRRGKQRGEGGRAGRSGQPRTRQFGRQQPLQHEQRIAAVTNLVQNLQDGPQRITAATLAPPLLPGPARRSCTLAAQP